MMYKAKILKNIKSDVNYIRAKVGKYLENNKKYFGRVEFYFSFDKSSIKNRNEEIVRNR